MGNTFTTEKEMCAYWKVGYGLYRCRKNRGVPMELRFEPAVIQESVQDHKGKYFDSIQAMCECYGVEYTKFCYRRKRGYSLEECLSSGRVNAPKGGNTVTKGKLLAKWGTLNAAYGS